MREAAEEAGVVGSIDPPDPLGSYAGFKESRAGGSAEGRVTVFGLRVEGSLADFREKGRRVLRWCSAVYGAELVHEPELAQLLFRFSGANATDSPDPAVLSR